MIYKKITVKKTPTGYSIGVFVRDGELVKPLYFGIQRFFDAMKKADTGQTELEGKTTIEDYTKDLKEAKIIDV